VNKYQGDVIRIEKLDPSKVYTVVYWDNAAKAYYVKRFNFTESNNTPVVFISDSRGSRLVDISSDSFPQMILTFGGKYEHREQETVDVSEFIARKGLSAKGKKCSPYDLKSVEFGEPLEKEVPEDNGTPDMADDVQDMNEEDVPEVNEGAPEATDDVPDGEDSGSSGGAVDFDDWEPTLF